MRRRKNIKKIQAMIVILLICFISIAYAYLSSNIQINGTAVIKNKKWDISLAISKKCITFATQMKIVLWCNGSTPDSGSVCEGSNPSRTTK